MLSSPSWSEGAVFAVLVKDVLKVYETIYLPRSVHPKTPLPRQRKGTGVLGCGGQTNKAKGPTILTR